MQRYTTHTTPTRLAAGFEISAIEYSHQGDAGREITAKRICSHALWAQIMIPWKNLIVIVDSMSIVMRRLIPRIPLDEDRLGEF